MFKCSTLTRLTNITEPRTCKYTIWMWTPLACFKGAMQGKSHSYTSMSYCIIQYIEYLLQKRQNNGYHSMRNITLNLSLKKG